MHLLYLPHVKRACHYISRIVPVAAKKDKLERRHSTVLVQKYFVFKRQLNRSTENQL